MESSKSDGNKEKEPQDPKTVVDNQTVVTIVDTNVEREIQNVLMTSENEQSQPSCSWKVTGQNPVQIEKGQPEAGPAKDSSTSSISVSIDVHSPQFKDNLTKVQENVIRSNEPTSRDTDVNNTDIGRQSSSLSNLFDDMDDVFPPPSVTQLHTPVTNQPDLQSSLVTNRPRFQLPVVTTSLHPPVTSRPRAHSPRTPMQLRAHPHPAHSRNSEVPPNSNRGIHVVNIPNDSINHSLQRAPALSTVVNITNNTTNQRADQVMGPPPSYSKSLLDRRVNPCASIQFVAPIPPPSYDGMENELRYAQNLTHTGGFTLGLGNTWQGQPQPAYCPVCETVIITQVDVRVSRIAHIVAMVMFLLLCWPFCLLPYFLNVCNYTFHYCSVCHSYLGARRPFQRG